MEFRELKRVNEEIFDNNSDLLKNVKFGTPWVETIILYLRNSVFKGSSSKLLIDIASNFEEIEREGTVIFDGQFKASRIPSMEEVQIAIELLKKNNKISSKINERMNVEGIKFINGLSEESHREILKEIDFEISSVPVLYYLLGYQFLDNRNQDVIYGVLQNGKLQKITEDNLLYEVSLSELSGIKHSSIFGASNLF